ncbi:unnamed protein product, partial [Phaeothamnion confervicola]
GCRPTPLQQGVALLNQYSRRHTAGAGVSRPRLDREELLCPQVAADDRPLRPGRDWRDRRRQQGGVAGRLLRCGRHGGGGIRGDAPGCVADGRGSSGGAGGGRAIRLPARRHAGPSRHAGVPADGSGLGTADPGAPAGAMPVREAAVGALCGHALAGRADLPAGARRHHLFRDAARG